MDDVDLQVELLLEADERDHDLGLDLDAFLLHHRGGFEDRARLHRGDFGVADAEAAAAEAEHRVELVQLRHARVDPRDRHAELLREVGLLLLGLRQELVQRRVEEPDGRRMALERAEDAGEILALVRQQLVQRRLPLVERLREDHFAHRVDAVALEEHVLRAAEADARRAERDRVLGLLRRVGVGAHVHARRLVAPFHQLLEVPELLRLPGGLVVVDQPGDDLGRRGLHASRVHLARGAVDRHEVAFFERLPVDGHLARLVVDLHGGGAADADLPHLPRDERGVRGDAAARRQDALRRNHAAQVFGRGLQSNEQDRLSLFGGGDGALGVQVDLSRGGARSRGQPRRNRLRLLGFRCIEHRRQQLLELIGGIAHHRRLPVDQLLLLHVDRELERRHRRALAVARLQHVDDAAGCVRAPGRPSASASSTARRAPACARPRPRLRPAR